ncbi:MAG: DNA repair protein RadA [Bacteroides sp. SM23_62_1]|nr:MAG: DNA repair protein RadA [Bacteroides sp. SM23_62_1]
MAKARSEYVCQNCGSKSPKWIGHCPACNEWNTYVEEIIQREDKRSLSLKKTVSTPLKVTDITASKEKRILSGMHEFNRILGGGIVPGSTILIGGEPGIGKSTLVLQLTLLMTDRTSLYVSGEESAEQIKLRAERIGKLHEKCYILTETYLDTILDHISNLTPEFIVIDSIQTLYTDIIDSSPGSVSQIRECASQLLRYAKEHHIPVVLIGHITKEGHIAGPKVLEHIVDTVLQFEGDDQHIYRLIRSVKNRYGSTADLGIFEMTSTGLREVTNPSEILLSNWDEQLSGVAIASTLDGIRPFLIEVQALVSSSVYATPQRSSTGFDLRRLSMLLAVLEKRAGFRLTAKDVFLNIAGGLKIYDPAIDLAVIISILSSNFDLPVDSKTCFAAEVGLSGEIRPVSRIEQRIGEAEKLGFNKIFVSKYMNRKITDLSRFKIGIEFVGKVEDVFKRLFDK